MSPSLKREELYKISLVFRQILPKWLTCTHAGRGRWPRIYTLEQSWVKVPGSSVTLPTTDSSFSGLQPYLAKESDEQLALCKIPLQEIRSPSGWEQVSASSFSRYDFSRGTGGVQFLGVHCFMDLIDCWRQAALESIFISASYSARLSSWSWISCGPKCEVKTFK